MRATVAPAGALGALLCIATFTNPVRAVADTTTTTSTSTLPTTSTTTSPSSKGPYYLALGDSLAHGSQPNNESGKNGYTVDLLSGESSAYPGLQLTNLGCPGETTTSFLNAHDCISGGQPQLTAAEAFLTSHAGNIAFVTLDIGANDVDSCISPSGVNLGCFENGLSNIHKNLPVILSGLVAVAPGVPIYVMNYYDPFLGAWLWGGSAQSAASVSMTGVQLLNGEIDTIAGAYGATLTDVATAFHTFAQVPVTYNGQSVPLNVALVCQWTWFCTKSIDIHANDTGYQEIASVFEMAITARSHHPGSRTWLASGDGGVFAFGAATFDGSLAGISHGGSVVALVPTPDGAGYWLATSVGGVYAFGDARFLGSAAGDAVSGSVTGMAPTPDGGGYWLVSSQGGVYAFGDAGYYGSSAGSFLAGPVVGITATPDGMGYLLATSGGQVDAYGDALSDGSLAGTAFPGTVAALVATADGNGYWLLTSSGGVYAFGTAQFFGAPASFSPPAPIAGGVATPDLNGYVIAGEDGGVYAFGSAAFPGSLGTVHLSGPIVSIAAD